MYCYRIGQLACAPFEPFTGSDNSVRGSDRPSARSYLPTPSCEGAYSHEGFARCKVGILHLGPGRCSAALGDREDFYSQRIFTSRITSPSRRVGDHDDIKSATSVSRGSIWRPQLVPPHTVSEITVTAASIAAPSGFQLILASRGHLR